VTQCHSFFRVSLLPIISLEKCTRYFTIKMQRIETH